MEIPDVFFGGESLKHQQKDDRMIFWKNFWVLENSPIYHEQLSLALDCSSYWNKYGSRVFPWRGN